MKIRHPLFIQILSAVAAMLIRLWIATLRVRVVSADGRRHPIDPKSRRYLYAFWHESLLATLAARGPKVQVLISRHADGELIAQVCHRLGVGTIRGSSTRGGSQAMFEMIRGSDTEAHLLFTPDGPRGPRRQVKPGLVVVASQASLPIVPIGIGFTAAWRVGSWDRFAVPLPFSTVLGIIGEPIVIPGGLDRGQLATYNDLVNSVLLRLTDEAEAWVERWRSGNRITPQCMPAPALITAEAAYE